MIQSAGPLDRLVEEYLAEVEAACAALPAAPRAELVGDLREHIAVSRARLDQESEVDIRTILDRLGEPSAIAAEARVGEPAGPVARVPLARPVRQAPRVPTAVIIAVVVGFLAFALCVGALLAGYALVRGPEPTPAIVPGDPRDHGSAVVD